MGYRLDDKEISLTGKRLTKIGTGVTGDVYKYRDYALKIFKKEKEPPIDEKTAEYLTHISVNRILLPKNLLFYNNSFRGYTYKLVSKKGLGNRIIMLKKSKLIENIEILEEDIERLSNKQVLLDRVEPENSIFNGDLYLTDPSNYKVLNGCPTEELEELNKYQLHLLLIALITQELRKNNFSSRDERQTKELLELRKVKEKLSNFFDEILGPNDSMKQLIRKMQ